MILPRTPSLRPDARRAVVSGAGRGIGLAPGAALAEAGAAATLVTRLSTEVDAAVEAIHAAGGTADTAALDVADLDAVPASFATRPAFDVLINKAGANRPKPMIDVTPADYNAVPDLKLKSAFFVARGAVRAMLAANVRGSLIHLSSRMGHVGGANRSLHFASKWALEGHLDHRDQNRRRWRLNGRVSFGPARDKRKFR